MSCTECNEENATFICACRGVSICSMCCSSHMGQDHHIYIPTLDLIKSNHKLQTKQVRYLKKQIDLVLDNFENKINNRYQEVILKSSEGLQVIPWNVTLNSSQILSYISNSLQATPPCFSDYNNLDKTLPIFSNSFLFLASIPSIEFQYIDSFIQNITGYSVAIYRTSIIVTGGCTKLLQSSNEIKIRHSNGIVSRSFMNYGRFFHSSIVIKNKLWIIGGYGNPQSAQTIEVFCLETNSIIKLFHRNEKIILPICYYTEGKIYTNFLFENKLGLLILDVNDDCEISSSEIQMYNSMIDLGVCKLKYFESSFLWTYSPIRQIDKKIYIIFYRENEILEYNSETCERLYRLINYR